MKLIPKYQRGDLVIRQDNTRVVRPPTFKPIKQRVTLKPQPQFTQDNRSNWQREQDSDRGDREYKRYMESRKTEKGLQVLNAFLDLTDYAGLATGVGSIVGKGLSVVGKQATKQLAKRAVGREFKRQSKHLAIPNNGTIPHNVGWGPKQSLHVIHDKDNMNPLQLYFPERWDAVNEGAPKAGIWYQGKLGNPRTAANHSIPGKAEKAANARDLFDKRPYRVEGDLELEKPIVTVGDVPNRAALEHTADKMGADGIVFNNVYDNGYSNNQIIFSFRDDLQNSRMFKKGSNTSVESKVDRTIPRTNNNEADFSKAKGNYDLMNQLDEFADKYGYSKANRNTILSNRKTNKQVRGLIARHNTYMRGVEPYGFESDDILNTKRILGDNMTREDFLKYAATHRRSPDQGIWISPESNAFMYGGRGETVYVRRPYKLGNDRSKWIREGDFNIQQRGTEITAPWYSPQYGKGNVETELISNIDLNFAGWANPNTYKSKVSLNNKVR